MIITVFVGKKCDHNQCILFGEFKYVLIYLSGVYSHKNKLK